MAEPITVLIVDDHALVRQGVRAFLEAQPDLHIVGEAASGEEALGLVQEYIPDVVLMDLVMPGMSGVEATRQVKQVSPRTQVVILTSYHEDEHIFPALRAGALSYTLKNIRSGELAEIIRKAAQGESVLHLLAEGHTNAAIAEQLVLSEKTVKGHVSNIFSKLHLQDRTQAAVFAWQQGLKERG